MDLKTKIGPLPAYVWGGLIGLAVLISAYWRSSTKKAATASTTTAPLDAIDGAFGPGTGNGSPLSAPVDNSGNNLATNGTWLTQAVDYLVGLGNVPIDVQAALQRYLNGDSLNAPQSEFVNKAIAKYGLPPNGTVGVSDHPDVASLTGAIQRAFQQYIGRAPTQQEINQYLTTPDGSAPTAQQITDAIHVSPAATDLWARGIIGGFYMKYYGRPMDEKGYQYWLSVYNQFHDWGAVERAMAAVPEAQHYAATHQAWQVA